MDRTESETDHEIALLREDQQKWLDLHDQSREIQFLDLSDIPEPVRRTMLNFAESTYHRTRIHLERIDRRLQSLGAY